MRTLVVTRATCGQVTLRVEGQSEVSCPIPEIAHQLDSEFELIQVLDLQFLTSMEADTLLTRLVDKLAVNGHLQVVQI